MPGEIPYVRYMLPIEAFTSRTRSVVHGSPSKWRPSYVGECHQSISVGCGTGMNTKVETCMRLEATIQKVNEHD